jgi:hypothetical protein
LREQRDSNSLNGELNVRVSVESESGVLHFFTQRKGGAENAEVCWILREQRDSNSLNGELNVRVSASGVLSFFTQRLGGAEDAEVS